MKNIPIIFPVFNQLTYLKNAINWWKWYYPENPIFVVDNASTYRPLLEFYESNRHVIKLFRNDSNEFSSNLKRFLRDEINPYFEYYVISDCDVMPHPNTPGNFLEHFKMLIEEGGYHRAGFNLIINDLPDHLNNKINIVNNESQFRNNPFLHIKGFPAQKAPIDTTFCLYTTKNSGWDSSMDGKDWGNCVRVFESFHLPWYQDPENVNEEMDFYYKNCKRHVPGEPSAGKNNNSPAKYKEKVEYCTSNLIINPAIAEDAIINDEFPGFKEDYLVLHCLLRQYKPSTLFEVGNNHGKGTKIMLNALPELIVYCLDLPNEFSDAKEKTGSLCEMPFTQLLGDSMTFNYLQYPCEAYFIDGAHTFEHVLHETTEILKLKPKLMIYHDANMPCVFDAVLKGFEGNDDYILTRVKDTRILYAIRK